MFAQKISEKIGNTIRITDSFQLLHDNYGLSPDSAKELAVALKLGTSAPSLEIKERTKEYYMWQITLILTITPSTVIFL